MENALNDAEQASNQPGEKIMRPGTLIPGLILSAVAIALIAYVYASRGPSNTVKPDGKAGITEVQAPAGFAATSEPDLVGLEQRSSRAGLAPSESPPDAAANAKSNFVDEDADRRLVREDATRDVTNWYSLLLDHLGLTPGEKDAMLSFLIEDLIARTRTRYASGVGMDKQEREDAIETIVGHARLQDFLQRERHLSAYAEVNKVGAGLGKNGTPLTAAQQDEYLDVLVRVRNQQTSTVDADRNTIEYLEQRLVQIDEYDRLVMEQVPSVLSPGQVEYLFEQYQRMSYQRAHSLEAQRKARADPNTQDLPFHYPARNFQ